jgi:hypothetical protein
VELRLRRGGCYRSLYQRAVLALGFSPTNVTDDAAFDAWYVYECAARHHGIAAVPLNQHAHPLYERDSDGTPPCPKGVRVLPLKMVDNSTSPFQTHFGPVFG